MKALSARLERLEQRVAIPDAAVVVLAGETEEEARERFMYQRGRPPAPGCPVVRIDVVDARVRPDPDEETSQ